MAYTSDMSGAIAKIRRIATDSRVGEKAATSVAKHSEQYVPYLSGKLRESATISPWLITYTMPYAHKQWTGEGITNRSTSGTRSHWEEAVNKGDVAREITAYLRIL